MSPANFALLAALTLLTATFALAAIVWWSMSLAQARRIQRRLRPDAAVTGDGSVGSLLRGLASRGKAIENLLDSEGEGARLMIRAGWRSPAARLVFYVLQGLTPLILLTAVGAFALFGPPTFTRPILLLLFAVAAAILGLLLPSMLRSRVARARQNRLRNEVPLFIHVLVLLFESGLSTRQAFSSLVREGRGVLRELGTEIEILLRQLEAGAEMSDALTKLSEALEVEDLSTVLSLLRQVERYGGEVKEPLLDTLQVIEDRREMDLREKVNLISGRMTVVMVLFFFPALLVFVAGPAWVSIIRALSGLGR